VRGQPHTFQRPSGHLSREYRSAGGVRCGSLRSRRVRTGGSWLKLRCTHSPPGNNTARGRIGIGGSLATPPLPSGVVVNDRIDHPSLGKMRVDVIEERMNS